tara:strand:- start:649 stop:2034 length:1386 start_codon:yes stop_codon:yes gene_type:complete
MVKPDLFNEPEIFLLNKELCHQLNLSMGSKEELLTAFLGEGNQKNSKSFAQAYAGHQFGHFTKLGDGRAIIVGEHLTENKKRFDIQLKGSGRTPYSRGGDGKATLKAMLREYLISEAIHYLNIPSSRSLAIIKTGESVYRETIQEGAILARVMKSHIRVGTFEYASYFGSVDDLKALTSYTINRLNPEIEKDENTVLDFLNKVMINQIELVVNWMRVGFIHGVMNTDNTSISGETFDYGPCAFINTYHPDTVYSSIDHNGRYAFGNQPKIIKWNISRFAEAILSIIHHDEMKSLELAQASIDQFDEIWKIKYYGMMLNKIGIDNNDKSLYTLVDELLDCMKKLNMDYTNTFWSLSNGNIPEDALINCSDFKTWLKKWQDYIGMSSSMKQAKHMMKKHNPAIIPRNHLVEQALEEMVNGNPNSFQRLLSIISMPYQYQDGLDEFMNPPKSKFERNYQTYCGT